MTDRGDNAPPPPDWHVEPKPWCDFCCVPANACGCPNGNRIMAEAYAAIEEAHLIRGEE